MKFAIFKLFCALNWCTLAFGAAIFENTVDAPGSGYAYVKPSAALLYPQEQPIAPNSGGFDGSKHAAQQTRRPLPQYERLQQQPPGPAVEAQLHLEHQQQKLLSQQQLDKQLEQDVLTAKRVSALQAVAFFGREAAPNKPTPSSGYDYKRPGTTFEYPQDAYKLDAPNELEQQFKHHEVASEHNARRCGPVKRIRVNQPTLLANAVGTSDDDINDLKAIVAERSRKRPAGRRLIPYTETLVDASYFVQ